MQFFVCYNRYMKKSIIIMQCVIFFSGCALQKETTITPTHHTNDARVAVVEKPHPHSAPSPASKNDVTPAPNVHEALVSWGHREAQRSKSDIDTVIIHSVYNPFDNKKHALADVLEIFKGYHVAPHYIIERDGTINRLVKERDIAWHAGRSRVPDGRTNVNDFAIGIEMINALDDTYTDAQYRALRALLEDIKRRYDIKYILGHDEIEVHDPWNFDWSTINDLRHEPR